MEKVSTAFGTNLFRNRRSAATYCSCGERQLQAMVKEERIRIGEPLPKDLPGHWNSEGRWFTEVQPTLPEKSETEKLGERLDRFEKARSLLAIHGMLSDAENGKCRQRIRKWCDKQGLRIQVVNCVGDPVRGKEQP